MEEEKKIEEIKSGETETERGPVDKAVEESVTELVDGNKEEEVADTQSAREGESGEEAPTETKAVDERAEKPMFTQSQVNELVGRARQEGRQKGYESARTELRERYGVDGDDDLDRIFADGGRFDELSSRYEQSGKELAEVRAELALARSGIVPERQSDARAILAGSGMDVSEENIASLLPTHPEWLGKKEEVVVEPKVQDKEIPQPKPMAVGIEPKPANDDEDIMSQVLQMYRQ